MSYASPYRGTTNVPVTSTALNLATSIESFRIINKEGGSITANVYLISGIYQICIMPNNYQIGAAAMFESQRPVVMLATDQIKVEPGGQVDYDFSLNNITP